MDIRDHAEDYAREMAGAWQNLANFHWYSDDRPEDAEKWCIYNTHHRDSCLAAESNAACIAKTLGAEKFADDVQVHSAGHWAVGWIEGFAVRVYDASGAITPAFLELTEILCALEGYPLLDECDHSQREYDACLKSIGQRSSLTLNAPEGWESEVFGYLWNSD